DTLFGSEMDTSPKTFQLKNKYIINTIKSGMLVIDQHRAHQRVLYEEFLRQITVQEGVSQQLLFPSVLEFSKPEIEILSTLKEQLEQTGFVFSKFENCEVELSGVPANVNHVEATTVLEQLIHDAENELPDTSFSQTDMLAKSLAKSLAIKSGKTMTIESQQHLVNSLFACKEPSITPTNRPTFITLQVEDLDKKFK
ncbi:MAG: DNA mismatch repair protein MutL, partial [Flavobacteriaceae bacterium]|nr:DNA mismatch repair protein MutL [Flavobacteriaceae bacterium]